MLVNSDVLNSLDELSVAYQSALPYPHIVIDNFLSESTLNLVLFELQKYTHWSCDDKNDYMKNYQVNKFYTPSGDNNAQETLLKIKQHAFMTYYTLNHMNSPEFLSVIERISGIKDIHGDPDFIGGGVHKTTNGGKLGVHVDFNIHWKMNTYRRLNLLIYLNKDWKDEYNGELELWEKDMSRCVSKVKPIFNRAILFNVTDDSFHGHPIPLNTPPEVARYSLAMYYYTKDRPEHEKSPAHSVLWRDT